MAFGIPTSTDLTGLATQIGTIVASVGPEESAVLQTAIQQLSDHATAIETKAAADAQALENPILQRLDSAIATLAKFEGYSNGFDISVTPKPGPTAPHA